MPLPGIEIGDLGPKMGDSANDTGYMVFKNVRIPREHMLSRFQQVTKEGKYIINKDIDPKLHYSTMMNTRAHMIGWSSVRLAFATTCAIRYNAVRRQGFKDTSTKLHKSPENQIIDYRLQQMRLFKQVGITLALKASSRWMIQKLDNLEGKEYGLILNSSSLKEIASVSAGLKALATLVASNGIEECRKACGGNGYLLSSGIALMGLDFLWQVTAEGLLFILLLYFFFLN